MKAATNRTAKESAQETFAENLKAARVAAGLTQAESAVILRVARRAVQQWEGGQRTPIYPAQWGALNLLGAQPPAAVELKSAK